MSANQIIDRIQERREQFDMFGVRSLALFGPVARGKSVPMAMLISWSRSRGPRHSTNTSTSSSLLEELIGRQVDLSTEGGLWRAAP